MIDESSLRGKRVLITREASQAPSFAEKVLLAGGHPISIPLIKITCLEHEQLDLVQYEWIFMTSANGVHCFMNRLEEQQQLDQLKSCQFAVVGHKTELALKSYGLTADFIPSVYNADTMAKEFRQAYPPDQQGKLLLVRGNISRQTLPREFKQHGYQLDIVEVYETSTHVDMKTQLNDVLRQSDVDFVTFTSPSTVRAFTDLIDDDVNKDQIISVCIGTTTEAAALQAGFTNILIPEVFTIEGMIDKMTQYISKKGQR